MLEKLQQRSNAFADALGYTLERTVRLVFTAAVGIFVARYLGPRNFGLLSYVTGIFALMAPFALLGMPELLVREFTTDSRWRVILASALGRQLPAAVATSALGFVIVAATRGLSSDAMYLAAALLPLPVLGLSATLRSYLEAVGRVKQIVLSGLVAAGIASMFKIAALAWQAPVWVFGAAATIESAIILTGLAMAVPGRKRLTAIGQYFHRTRARSLLRESWPLLLSALAVTIYVRADVLMLGVMAGDRQTGIYTAAARLSEVWYFIPIAAAAAARPRLARMYANEENERYQSATQRFMSATFGVSLLVVLGTLLTADLVIHWLYGEPFAGAGDVLQIHVLATPFVFLGVAGSQWFIDRGMTRAVMIRAAAGAAINVLLNLILIPRYGATGAAIATLVAYSSGVLLNALPPRTRPLFFMQVRALVFRWPRTPQ